MDDIGEEEVDSIAAGQIPILRKVHNDVRALGEPGETVEESEHAETLLDLSLGPQRENDSRGIAGLDLEVVGLAGTRFLGAG